MRGFSGGSVVKNLPANAGDTGSIPDPGRPHIAAEPLRLCTTTAEPVLEPRSRSYWRRPLDLQPSLWNKSEVAQSCPTLCNPLDCSLSGSSVHGIFQATVLEWIAISFSRGSSQPRARTHRRFTIWATREVGETREATVIRSPHSPQLEKSPYRNEDPAQPPKKLINEIIFLKTNETKNEWRVRQRSIPLSPLVFTNGKPESLLLLRSLWIKCHTHMHARIKGHKHTYTFTCTCVYTHTI